MVPSFLLVLPDLSSFPEWRRRWNWPNLWPSKSKCLWSSRLDRRSGRKCGWTVFRHRSSTGHWLGSMLCTGTNVGWEFIKELRNWLTELSYVSGPQSPCASIVYLGVHVVDFSPFHQQHCLWIRLRLLGLPYRVWSWVLWIQACVDAWLTPSSSALSFFKKWIRCLGC